MPRKERKKERKKRKKERKRNWVVVNIIINEVECVITINIHTINTNK